MKVNLKTYFLSLLFVFFSLHFHIAYGQNTFNEGFIIYPSLDTLYGQIKVAVNVEAQKRCTFLKDGDSEPQTFSPSELFGYGFKEGTYFESLSAEIDSFEEQIFLECLVKSEEGASLYYFFDGVETTYYFIKKENDGLQKLSNETTQKRINGKLYEQESRTFVNTLTFVLRDCQEISSSLETLPFDLKKLSAIVQKYNNCTGVESSTFVDKRKILIRKKWGVTVSLDGRFRDGTFSPSVSGGVFGEFGLNIFRSTQFLRIEALYTNLVLSSVTRSVFEPGTPIEEVSLIYTNLNLHYIKLPILIRYYVGESNTKFFANAGVIPIVRAGSKLSGYTEVTSVNGTDIYENTYTDPTLGNNLPITFGYTLGLGIQIKSSAKFSPSLELRHESLPLKIGQFELLDRIRSVSLVGAVRF